MIRRCVGLLTVLLCTSATAQVVETGVKRPAEEGKLYRGHFYVPLSGVFLKTGALSDRLSAYGFPGLNGGPSVGLGFGGRVAFGTWIFGADTEVLFSSVAASQTDETGVERSVTISGNVSRIYVGYDVLSEPSWSLTPALGFGSASFKYKLQETSPSQRFDGLNEVLADPRRQAELDSNSVFMFAELGVEWFLGMDPTKQKMSEVMIGLRVGYADSPFPMTSDLTATPALLWSARGISFTGPYLRLVVGLGGSVH